jgi:hypothetical protein
MIRGDLPPLLVSLSSLHSLYPDLRFGQLIEMAALLTDDAVPVGVAELEDDRLRGAAEAHARERPRRLGIEGGPPPIHQGPRAELLDALGRAYQDQGDRRFGRFVGRLAAVSGAGLYDVEDEQLIAAARGLTVDVR